MRSFTKSGFLWYEYALIYGKPGLYIYSDKQTYSEYFSSADLRQSYKEQLDNALKNVGVALYQIPYTAIWINPVTVLSVKVVRDLIILEFPWNFSRELKFDDGEQLKEVYDDIIRHLGSYDPSDIEQLKERVSRLEEDVSSINVSIEDLQSSLEFKADDDSVVHSKGVENETVDGNKTFTGILTATETIPEHDSSDRLATTEWTVEEINSKLSTVFKYKGSVNNYSDLPDKDQMVGDVWNIINADPEHDIDAGDNVAWNGTDWDNLKGIIDLSIYLTKAEASELYNTKQEIDAKDIETIKSILGRVWSTTKYPDDPTKGYFQTTYTHTSGTNAGSYAKLWNESDGGGSQYYNKNANIVSYVGTNDGGTEEGAICAQIYSKNKSSNNGSRLNINPTGIYYTSRKTNSNFTAEDEVAVKRDINELEENTYNKSETDNHIQVAIEENNLEIGTRVITSGITLESSVRDDLDINYPYLNTFNVATASANDIARVIFNYEQSISGKWSPYSETGDLVVKIRSTEEILDANNTFLAIILQRVVN